MLSILVSLFIGASGPSLEELPVQRVEAIAQQVVNELSQHQGETPTLVVTPRPEPTPLGAISYAGGHCKIIINPTASAWAQWGRFLTPENQNSWDQIIAASVAHEFGHCMKDARLGSSMAHLSEQTLSALGSIGQTSASQATRVLKQELFSDTVAVLYAKNTMDENTAETVIQSIYQARLKFGSEDPSHDTSRELGKVIHGELSLAQGEKISQAATRILSGL